MGKRRRFGRVRNGCVSSRPAATRPGMPVPTVSTGLRRRLSRQSAMRKRGSSRPKRRSWPTTGSTRMPPGFRSATTPTSGSMNGPTCGQKQWSCTATCCAVTWSRHSGPGPWQTSMSRMSGPAVAQDPPRGGRTDTGLVFTTRYGTPIEPRNFNRSFDYRIARAAVRRINVHGTRKTCGTLLAALDVHPRVAMQILRHSRIAVTMEIYTEATSEATRDALKRLGDELSRLAIESGQPHS